MGLGAAGGEVPSVPSPGPAFALELMEHHLLDGGLRN